MASSNTFVKKANRESEYTPDLIQELQKCMNDPIYCIKNYFYITHPKQGKILFNLYPFQEELIDSIHHNRDVIVLASRQMGKCVSKSININVYKKPNKFKMFILRFIDKGTYDEISKM